MVAPAARGSTKATRRLLLHPAPRGRSVRGRHEIRSTAAPADALPLPPQPLQVAAEAAPAPLGPLPRRSVPALPSNSYRTSYRTSRCTAPSNSSDVNGFTTYPSAPCCWAQNLSLCELLELTSTTGMRPNSWWCWSAPKIGRAHV